jgi:TonB dependent receptor
MRHVGRGVLLVLAWAALAAADPQVLIGRSLEEALRLLQQAGLSIVFSSEVVKPTMRVVAEPHAPTLRLQLDELLAPHGLKAESGPGRLIFIVRDRSTVDHEPPRRARSPTQTLAPGSRAFSAEQAATTYADHVTVRGLGQESLTGGGSDTTFDRNDVRAASSVLASDGLEAVLTMPGVIAGDDFRNEFTVRGSPYRQIGIVVDGVATPFLQHMVYGRNDAGSLSMFAGDIVDRMTLQAGAYPRRYEDVLGAQLVVNLKEGSRESVRLTARAGGTSAAFVGEGPIGNDRRGSWVAGVRNSYRTWPPRELSQNDVGFAFGDIYAKLVYDVSTTNQVSVTALAGRSTLDTVDEPLVSPLGTGTDRAGLLVATWQSTLGTRTVVRQRVFFTGQALVSTLPTGQVAGRNNNRALGYQGEALHSLAGGVLEAGAEISSMSGTRDTNVVNPAGSGDPFDAGWTTRAAYVNYSHAAPRGLSFEIGARVSGSTLVDDQSLAPWVRAAWPVGAALTITASAGTSRQFPTIDEILGPFGSRNLAPERATNVDVGIEQRLPGAVWQATLFNRLENDVLRRPDLEPRPVQGDVLGLFDPARYRNALSGASRGIELVVTPHPTARWSGWMSYTYAMARQMDIGTGERFWSDVDRRHVLNAAGVLGIGHRASMGLVLRAASGVPIPGYFDMNNGRLFIGDHLNDVRLPPYLRLDARVQRTFFASSHAVTFFGEVSNALNRHNEGLAEGVVRPGTAEVIGFSRPLLPRTTSVGIQVSLQR